MPLSVLVCVKRIPATAGRITLTEDEQGIDVRYLGFAIGPHEECAVEEAVQLVETHGGRSTVLTLGPAAAEEQLRDALALGIDEALLLETDGSEWDGGATGRAIVEAVGRRGFDLLLFGNEAADTGGHQVGIRVAHDLGLPCVSGAKQLRVEGGVVVVGREGPGGWEVFRLPLPAVVSVKEGINLPRYPSMPGRIRARKKQIERLAPVAAANGLRKIRLMLPEEPDGQAELLGTGPDAAPRILEVLRELGIL